MNYKTLSLLLLFSTFLSASVQEIRIGKIDEYYQNKLSSEELRSVIDEIEDTLESQLGYDLFNYSEKGKPIYIKYVAPQQLEKSIERNIKKLEKKKEKIATLRKLLPNLQRKIKKQQKDINIFTSHINKKTAKLNEYILGINKKKHFTVEQYKQAQVHAKSRQKRIDREVHVLKQDRRRFKKMTFSYNNKIHQLNSKIRSYNILQNQISRMTRSVKKVKGKAFGMKEITLKTFYKDGKKVRERSVTQNMTKIEIYGFETRSQLRAVLAHEIGHLVGIPHIHSKNALMNPYLQKNQIENLLLTQEDIDNFNTHF